ncbi:Uncharacterized protein Cob_v012882 [Colletotrichum orbiculare MAFF 240422]|uniref:Uncharacterized protein n=1 Tax=Colletotrichum orbiculare (strain 104-T / ATCC 96160 / CBS 514.97 / LARS 414 / MAFF 240422) TaxID=1213857 RepID=N4V3J2_COLOR|nr:Uncharacterized protein Cob_v012882 [Colletotrichum orbiculare MAFF 240422]
MPFWKRDGEKDIVTTASAGNVDQHADGDLEPGVDARRHTGRVKCPTDSVTLHQLFYIFGMHGVGAAIISGGISFAIAYAMYTSQNPSTSPVRLFKLPNTLAGDAVVSLVFGLVITWFVEYLVVDRDLRAGGVRPIGFVGEPERAPVRWLMLLDLLRDGGHRDAAKAKRMPAFLWDQALRIGVLFVASFFLFWCPAVGILAAAVGTRTPGGGDWDWYFSPRWAPQVFKAVFGGVLALLTTPAMASFWLVREGWRLKREGALLG